MIHACHLINRKIMKAITIREFGGPEVLKMEEIPTPQPSADEVLIKIYASGVNPIDWKIRKGLRKEKFPTQFPLVLGWDVSGVVQEAGSNVTDLKPGDEVYGRPDPTKNGTYAEYIVVKASEVAIKPKTIDHIHAAGVPLAGLTAWQGLFDHGHLEQGQRVLIHAASGGVGTFAVQFAKWKGAYVIGTTSTENINFVKQLGADEVIDYKKEKFDEKIENIDLVFDTLGGETQTRSLKVLKKGGTLVTTLKPENEGVAKEKNIHIEGYMALSTSAGLKKIAELIDAGKVKPIIAKVFPLKDAAKAQSLSEEGHTVGKIILQVV
jgi:NADPH:quinone reductase-like Zn-dependent oxidoreductase